MRQYQKRLRPTNNKDFKEIIAKEYAPNKRQHCVSWTISSAFPSNSVCAGSLVVNRLSYGRGHT